MRLIDLRPGYEPAGGHGQHARIHFTCPACRKGVVMAWITQGEPSAQAHGCNSIPPDWHTLTLTPSVAAEGQCRHCPGWHGFIANGEVTP